MTTSLVALALFLSSARAADPADEAEEAAAFQLALTHLSGPLAPLAPEIVARADSENNVFALTVDAMDAIQWLVALHEGRDWKKQVKAARAAPVVGDDTYSNLLDGVCSDPAVRVDIRWGFCAAVWHSMTTGGIADWRLHAILSRTAGAYGDPEVAFAGAVMARELNPHDADSAYQLVNYALYAHRMPEAAAATVAAMGLRVDEDVVVRVATALVQQAQTPVALEVVARALVLRPESGRLLMTRGTLLVESGDAAAAIVAFGLAEEHGYAGADLYLAWGNALVTLDRPAEAREEFRKAVAIDPAATVPEGMVGGPERHPPPPGSAVP